jgi:hypothetical protein
MPINTSVGSPGTVSSASGGKVTAQNAITTVGAQVVAQNPQRVSIVFHNPGANNIFVYPLVNALGGVNAPTNAAPGGSFEVFPGGLLTISGECQTAWGAFANTGTTNALTIMESNL